MPGLKDTIVNAVGNKKISFYAYLALSFAFTALAPLIVSTYLNYVKIEKVVGSDALKSAETNLNYISENIDSYLTELDLFCSELLSKSSVSAYMRTRPKDSAELEAMRKRVRNEVLNLHISRRFNSILLYPENGFMFSYGLITESSMDDFRQYSVYVDAMNQWGKTLFVPLHTYAGINRLGNSREVFSCARSLKDINTFNMMGVIEITFDESMVSSIIRSTSISRTNKILLVSDNNRVIAGTESSNIGKMLPDNIARIVANNKSGIRIKTNEGEQMIVVSKLDKTGWKLIEEIQYGRLIQSVTVLKKYFIFVILLVALFSAIIISLAILFLSNSIKSIVDAITDIKNGNLTAGTKKIPFREFSYIGQNINDMARKLVMYIEQIILEQKQKRDMELKMLQAQITPHFLYNTLYSISCMAKNKNENDIAANLDALVMLLKTAVSVKNEMITIKEELEITGCYLSLENTRSNNKFTINYEIDATLLQCKIPKMVLQPIVENSIMHGFVGDVKNCEVRISLMQSGEDILITVQDNGEGMDRKEIEDILNTDVNNRKGRFSGIGLANVDQKIKLYFGERFGISILSGKGAGTLVSILIPECLEERGR